MWGWCPFANSVRLSRLPARSLPFIDSRPEVLSSPVVFKLNDLDACGRWNSLLSLVREFVDDAFSFRDPVGDRSLDDWPVGDFCPFAAAAAAACCARSLREAFPLFFRSRMYSQPNPNSVSRQHNSNHFLSLIKAYQHNERMGFDHHISFEVGCIDRKLC